MKLDTNPYTYIPTPRFGDDDYNAKIDAKWQEWRDATKAVNRTFQAIADHLPPKRSTRWEHETSLLTKNLCQPADKIRSALYEAHHVSIKVADEILEEAARRVILYVYSDPSVNSRGQLEWEKEIEDSSGTGKRAKASQEHDSELFASTEVAELRARVAELEAENARLRGGA